MTEAAPNACRYFAFSPEMARWGLGITAAGRADIPAGAQYPFGTHPDDHQLAWEQGRALDALQVVLITQGSGWLETHATGLGRVTAGMLFLLLPRRWHRYRPDPATGWCERWVEMRGPVVDSLVSSGTFPDSSALLSGAIGEGIEERLDALLRPLLFDKPQESPAGIAAMGLGLLAACAALLGQRPSSSPSERAVRRAASLLAANHSSPPPMEDLARSVGMAYSPFRRAFKQATGLPPWQYVIQARLSHARRLLASTHATLDEIAAKTGFGSAFHLSHAFKKAHGIAPARWRTQLQSAPPADHTP